MRYFSGSSSCKCISLSRPPRSFLLSAIDVRSSIDPEGELSGLARGLGSGDGRVVACRERSKILRVSASMSTPSVPGYNRQTDK